MPSELAARHEPGSMKREIKELDVLIHCTGRLDRENPEFSAKVMARLPIKRWAAPMELAGTALFLASTAGRLVNGVTIPVDGGYGATS